MNQRGSVEGYLIAGAVVVGMGVAIAIQTYRLDSLRVEYAEFKAGVEVLGKAAEKAAKEKEAKDKANKERSDAEKKRLTADLAVTAGRLRQANSRIGDLSAPAPDAASPTRTCFDPAQLSAALRSLSEGIKRFDEGVLGIAVEGSQAVIDLDVAKRWAKP